MDQKEIPELLKYGEKPDLECRKAEGGLPGELWQTYSSFANTCGGISLVVSWQNG